MSGPATFAGTIEEAGGVDAHPLTLTAGQIVYVAGSGECASTVDYHLATPSGTQVGGSPYVCNDIGRVVAPEAGTYELVVESFAGGTGPYSIDGGARAGRCDGPDHARSAGERGDQHAR